jgi:hypothetical protein
MQTRRQKDLSGLKGVSLYLILNFESVSHNRTEFEPQLLRVAPG